MENSLIQMLLKGPIKVAKHPITFKIEINGNISKNHFDDVLVTESNLEWVEQCLRSKEVLLSNMVMNQYRNQPNVLAVGRN